MSSQSVTFFINLCVVAVWNGGHSLLLGSRTVLDLCCYLLTGTDHNCCYLSNSLAEEVEVNLRPTVSRPVCLGAGHPSGTRDQLFSLLEISFKQLRVCYFAAPSLTREQVCNLLYNCFWALPEQSLLGRSPAELTAIFYCLIWDSPNLEGQVPGFISPGHWVPFLSPLTTPRATWRYSRDSRPYFIVPRSLTTNLPACNIGTDRRGNV
jgi:hypothetical protein